MKRSRVWLAWAAVWSASAAPIDSPRLLRGMGEVILPLTWNGPEADLEKELGVKGLEWTVDGKKLTHGRLRLGEEPGSDSVRVHKVEAQGSDGAKQAITLVVIPPATASKFRQWLEAERREMKWIGELPAVYTSLGKNASNPEPEACKTRRWTEVRKVSTQYHPGAAYEMRSVSVGGGWGHQAMYDSSGALLRTGLGAGSADRSSPSGGGLPALFAHRDNDVVPFVWAAQLDGNPVNPKPFYMDLDRALVIEGQHLRAYGSVRPVFVPGKADLPPGVCAD